MSVIKTENLTKRYKSTLALDDVSVSFGGNKIYGLLGRNGAGKTTLINIITNRLFATSGSVTVDGENAVENDRAQGKIFCMTEKGGYPAELKVKDGFKWAKGFYEDFDTEYAYNLSEKFKLDTNKWIKSLSTGYESIFKLILTLSSGAPILILDEPTLGLDANYRDLLYKELIALYNEQEKTIVISTHLIDEIADILEHVIIIEGGKIIADDETDKILAGAYTVAGDGERVNRFIAQKNVIKTQSMGSFLSATVLGQLSAGEREQIKKEGLDLIKPKLQELFISMTSGGTEI